MTITIGANWHGIWEEQDDPAVRDAILTQLELAGVTSVRLDFAWDQIEPTRGNYSWSKLDSRMDEATAHGMTLLLMLYWPPPWAIGSGSGKGAVPRDPAEYGNICGQVGRRYGAKLAGVEMWNEPDLEIFWKGTRGQYFDLLAGAYPAAKQLAPNTTFLAAAPTYLGLASNWYRDAYATDTYRPGVSYDACGIHPYMSPSNLPPNAPASDHSIHGIAELQEMRAAHGDTSPLWATEFGWSTHDNPAGSDPWKMGVSETEQAAYTLGAYILMESYDVAAGYVYTERDVAQESDPHEHNFGILYGNITPKPAAQVLRAVHEAPPPEPPDGGGSDTDARIAALEARVAELEAQDAELAANLQEAAHDLA